MNADKEKIIIEYLLSSLKNLGTGTVVILPDHIDSIISSIIEGDDSA